MAPRTSSSSARTQQAAASGSKSQRKQEHFLIFREDGSNKFWFARWEGARWTAEWGRRGGKAQTKTYTFRTPEQARANFEAKVREKLDKGYAPAPAGARAKEAVGKPSYRFKLGRGGEDQYGGMPPGVDAAAWPKCKDCRLPMQFLFLLNAHPERVPLRKSAALAVFMCDGSISEGGCETWSPGAGANAVLLLSGKALASPALKQPPASAKGAPQMLARRGFRYREKFEQEPTDEGWRRGCGTATSAGRYCP